MECAQKKAKNDIQIFRHSPIIVCILDHLVNLDDMISLGLTSKMCLKILISEKYRKRLEQSKKHLIAVTALPCLIISICSENQTLEICMAAVKTVGLQLKNIDCQTERICITAVQQDWKAFHYVIHQTPKICIAAVSASGLLLQFVKTQTFRICMAAVIQNPAATKYVESEFMDEVSAFWDTKCWIVSDQEKIN